jgi:hypothetical protein
MTKKRFAIWAFIPFLAVVGSIPRCTEPTEMAPRISREDLKARLDDPSLVILDVQTHVHWKESAVKIKGAIRENPVDSVIWSKRYPKGKTIALY